MYECNRYPQNRKIRNNPPKKQNYRVSIKLCGFFPATISGTHPLSTAMVTPGPDCGAPCPKHHGCRPYWHNTAEFLPLTSIACKPGPPAMKIPKASLNFASSNHYNRTHICIRIAVCIHICMYKTCFDGGKYISKSKSLSLSLYIYIYIGLVSSHAFRPLAYMAIKRLKQVLKHSLKHYKKILKHVLKH